MSDIRDHGGAYGGGKGGGKKFKYSGVVSGIGYYSSFLQTFVPAKDYAYSSDSGWTSVVNLAANSLYGQFNKSAAYVKATSLDDDLFAFSGGLIRYTPGMATVWSKGSADNSNSIEWKAVAIGKQYVYYLETMYRYIYKVNKATGALVAKTTATFSNNAYSCLNLSEDESELYYTTNNNGQISINVIRTSDMALMNTYLPSLSGNGIIGVYKKGNTFYIWHHDSSYWWESLIDISNVTLPIYDYRLMGAIQNYTQANSLSSHIYKDGIVLNVGNSGDITYFVEFSDAGHTLHMPEKRQRDGRMKMTDKRWIQMDNSGKMYHGTFS